MKTMFSLVAVLAVLSLGGFSLQSVTADTPSSAIAGECPCEGCGSGSCTDCQCTDCQCESCECGTCGDDCACEACDCAECECGDGACTASDKAAV